jgi:hypothetical protein
MTRYFSCSIALFALILAGCGHSVQTVVIDWTADMSFAGDSVAAGFAEVLGESPDSLQRCSGKRIRLALVNRPGAFPVTGHSDGNATSQSGPNAPVEANLVRSIGYASVGQLERFGIDTLVVTLTRSSPAGGSQPSTYEITRSDLSASHDAFSSYSAPVEGVSLHDQPCGSPRQ